jgi:hypothetical protein
MDKDQLTLNAECVVAVVGVAHALKAKPSPPSEVEMRRALRLPAILKKRVGELVSATKQAKQAEPPELPKYTATHESLAAGLDGDVLVEVMVGIPQELQAACTMVWSRAVSYLNERFPRRTEQRLTGIYLHEPSRGEWAEFGWAWRIANNPLFVIDLASEGMLIGVEVEHFKAMYPTLYGELCGDIFDALSDQVAENKEWQAPWWLRKQLCGILGISPVSATLVADIEAAVKQSQTDTKTRTGALSLKGASTGETQNQSLASGGK